LILFGIVYVDITDIPMLLLSGSIIRRKLFVGSWIAVTSVSMAGWLAVLAWISFRAIQLLIS
jgi:hypothetical protein